MGLFENRTKVPKVLKLLCDTNDQGVGVPSGYLDFFTPEISGQAQDAAAKVAQRELTRKNQFVDSVSSAWIFCGEKSRHALSIEQGAVIKDSEWAFV